MSGKGSRRRPTNIPKAEADANYESIFGKYVPLYMRKQIPEEPVVTKQTTEEKPKEE
jgi:hypothetical protein